MSTPMMRFAAGVALSWVRLYTAGLPRAARDARRAEIESDLWEHGAGNGADGVGAETTALQVLGRLLLGVPADLSWRLELVGTKDEKEGERSVSGRRMSVVQTVVERGLVLLTILLAGMYIVFGQVALVSMGDEGWDPHLWERALFGLMPIVAGGMILWGLLISKRSPWMGASLLTVGAVGMAAVWFWMLPFMGPVTLVVVAFGILRARGFARERDRIAPA